MATYANDLKPTDVAHAAHGKDMVQGRGGGYGFHLGDMERLRRFLILGHEGGTYYADQRTLTHETVDCLDRLAETNPADCVAQIVKISKEGRAPKNDHAIFAIAYLASKTGTEVSVLALKALKDVCRTGTMLFDFLNNCKALGRGWGSAFKREIGNWFDRNPLSLAKQVTKYPQRNGWSMRDVLRKCHFHSPAQNNVLRYVTQRDLWFKDAEIDSDEVTTFLMAVEACKSPKATDQERIRWIHDHGLVREHLPTESLNNPAIWEALLENMPLTAMIRNLGKMTNIGVLKPLSDNVQKVCDTLRDAEALKAQRVHPVALLLASRVYAQGRGVRGSLSWQPAAEIRSALNDAFYLAFRNVEPTNKRFLLGVDVSGSMGMHRCVGSSLLTAREAACVMAMVAARTEPRHQIMAFTHRFVPLDIHAGMSLEDCVRATRNLSFGRTNCAQPITYAMDNDLEVDCFCVYTDNETNYGPHPFHALREYRNKTGINAKLAVFGFANSNFTVADPSDKGMLDFVGFDANAPKLLNEFALA